MSKPEQFQHQIIEPQTATLTVAEDQKITSAVNLFGTTAVGVFVPAGLVSTSLSFQVSMDGITYKQLKDSNNQVLTVDIDSSGAAYPLQPSVFAAWRWMKIVCGSNESSDAEFIICPLSV